MELLERASQLQALNSALSLVKAREGQGCIALVYGEAGIGKTSLEAQPKTGNFEPAAANRR
jgi:DNA replication protein DnaC